MKTAKEREESAHLAGAEAEAIGVGEEVGEVEEFGRQLLHVARVHQAVVPGGGNAAEQPVRVVKPAPLPSTPPCTVNNVQSCE